MGGFLNTWLKELVLCWFCQSLLKRGDLKRCCPRECGLKNNGNKRGQSVLGGP